VSTPIPLPTDLAEAHALILRQCEELAAAEARASGAEALIAHMKLVIAKLRREQYGQSSERGRKVLDQLELQLEELEAETSENAVTAADKAAGVAVKSFARQRPYAHPYRPTCRASGSLFQLPARVRSAAAGWPSSAKISPRLWKSFRANGR
jgi:Transposase C of IS166 homeodomain